MRWIPIAVAWATLACAPRTTEVATTPTIDADWAQELAEWKEKREEGLKREYGWFSVAGLFWLGDGENALGSAQESAVVLPRTAQHAGTLIVSDAGVRIRPVDGVKMRVGEDVIAKEREVAPDKDKMYIDDLEFYVIERGGRLGVRLKDPQTSARKDFDGLDYFEPNPKWRVSAKLERFDTPLETDVATVIETSEKFFVPGKLSFEVDGTRYELEPYQESGEDEELFIIFRDETAGKETYGLGRYVYADVDKNGAVELDFNRAYNPPCAFTDYATCPIPPPSNVLGVRIDAGELAFAGTRVGIQH